MILKAIWSLYGRFRGCDGYADCLNLRRTNRVAYGGHIHWLCKDCERVMRRDRDAVAKVKAAPRAQGDRRCS